MEIVFQITMFKSEFQPPDHDVRYPGHLAARTRVFLPGHFGRLCLGSLHRANKSHKMNGAT